MNSKGQLIITELILYIIIIVICISMILYIFNTINNNQVMILDNRMTNQILEDTMDTLIMSERTPSNWDNLSDKDIKTIANFLNITYPTHYSIFAIAFLLTSITTPLAISILIVFSFTFFTVP